MIASETIFDRAHPWLRTTGRSSLRVLLPLPVFAIVWWYATVQFGTAGWAELIGYALLNLAILLGVHYTQSQQLPGWTAGLLVISAASDALLALILLSALGPLSMAIFPTYVILGLKVLYYRKEFLWIAVVPLLLGPLYLSTLYIRDQGPAGLSASQLVAYWGLVGGSVGFIVMLLVLSERRLQVARRLSGDMNRLQAQFHDQVTELESINRDLRVRIRSQQALEESLRAITGSLSLDEVFSQILDSTLQMFGPSRVTAAALSLTDGEGFTHRTLGIENSLPDDWPAELARRVVHQRSALVLEDLAQERDWRNLYRHGAAAALTVPLIAVDGRVLGALSVISAQAQAFTSTEVRHLNSFSIQVSVAIHNASLHSQLARQRVMLEAVLRDIGDGLVVIDDAGDVTLANPIAYQALTHSDNLNAGLREQLLALAHDVCAADTGKLRREIHMEAESEEHERVYQAFASPVEIAADETSRVAIVLHDITANKAEERARLEFISMVSHELRSPLHTLNGFIKIILQEKAGSLSELQREFLELADAQGEQLKLRISELLEFNRLQTGRLRMQPEWGELQDVIEAASVRLQMQAEEAGLRLSVAVAPDLPDVLMDSERVDQVITNLVENAIKATPAGGSILIAAEMGEREVVVRISDTGIGIRPEDQQRIFDRFFRADNKASHHGSHLGLGLSICKQIVEAHNGRIWVESVYGEGSTFAFSLPLVSREEALGTSLVA